jgi:hypothetical protein
MQVSQTGSPIAISTSGVTTAPPSGSDVETELFHNIEQLVRKFVRCSNCDYPCYRVIRWFEGNDPMLEHILTVVINRPIVSLKKN